MASGSMIDVRKHAERGNRALIIVVVVLLMIPIPLLLPYRGKFILDFKFVNRSRPLGPVIVHMQPDAVAGEVDDGSWHSSSRHSSQLACNGMDFVHTTSCSFMDASHYFACRAKYPRTGSFIPSSASWQAYGVCKAKPQDIPGACLFQQQQNSGQPKDAPYIVVLGDSQGMNYAVSMIKHLNRSGAECHRQQHEKTSGQRGGDVSYFGVPNAVARTQDCSACTSFRTRCVHPRNNTTVLVEYVRLEFILDFELTTKPLIHWDNSCNMSATRPCKWAWSTQQFLLEHYFGKVTPIPTQMHIFQNVHDPARRTLADYRRDLTWFVDLLDATIGQSPSTEIYFWEATCPNAAKQGAWAPVTSKEYVSAMNSATKQAILPFVRQTVTEIQGGTYHTRKKAAWHATFDLFTPSLERLDLVVDGIHLVTNWYDTLAGMLLQAYCRGQQ